MNQVILIGRLTKDPELQYIQQSGIAVARFTLAVDRDYTSKDGNKQPDFIPIEVWNKSAENCANFISKGSLVAVQGSLRIENYQTNQGEKRTMTKVRAQVVKFLESKNKGTSQNNSNNGKAPVFEPTFNPMGLDPDGFQAIDDEDIPF